MSLLLDTGLPYARLALFTRKPRVPVAARNDERADALGEGLRRLARQTW